MVDANNQWSRWRYVIKYGNFNFGNIGFYLGKVKTIDFLKTVAA